MPHSAVRHLFWLIWKSNSIDILNIDKIMNIYYYTFKLLKLVWGYEATDPVFVTAMFELLPAHILILL